MNAAELLAGAGLKDEIPSGIAATEVRGVAYDSRRVEPGSLFFAFPGAKTDGRSFAAEALKRGALAVLSELHPPEDFSGAWLQVDHGRQALATVAARLHNNPDRRLWLTGITGTNGKTTTAFLADSVFRTAGKTTGLLGTIQYRLADEVRPAVNTTPESLDLFAFLAECETRGGSHVTLEVSSHALELGRVYGVYFRTAVFTNLTRDHLDFHGTMENYFAAKQRLFTGSGTEGPEWAVINIDDGHGRSLKTAPQTEVLTYAIDGAAAVRAVKIHSSFEGLRFDIHFDGRTYPIASRMTGRVNVYNILAAWAAAYTAGIAPEQIAEGIAALPAVPGRFERVDEGQPFLVAVDYAHTDDALRNTLATARALTKKRVITVFGCGGDRDRTKRPLMGMAAAEASDFVVVTSDNPRSENPVAIINDTLVGLRRFDTPLVIEPDRARAIAKALEEASAGDVVVIAGKGHETYQVLQDRTIDFDDREVARHALHEFGYGRKN